MNPPVPPGHGSKSPVAPPNGVILQENNAAVITAAVITTHHESKLRFKYKLHYLVICAVVTAAVTTAALFPRNITPLKNATKDSLPRPTIQTNSFCFGSNITVFPCPMSIYKFIFILSRNPLKMCFTFS